MDSERGPQAGHNSAESVAAMRMGAAQKRPPLSVVMSVYNCRRYVREAIDSILGQTFRDFEFVIVDDGSDDGTGCILQEYAQLDARVKLISRPNTGCWKASNDGIAASSGEFIARMDADDVCFPERFAKQLAFLRSHPEIVAVGTHVLLIDADGEPLRTMPQKRRLTHEEIDEAHLTGGGQVLFHPTLMMRREAVEKVGLYREWPAGVDLDLFLRLAEIGRLANLPDVLLKYRQHMGSIGHAKMKLQLENCREMVHQAYQRRGMPLPRDGKIGFERVEQRSETEQHRKWAWWALRDRNVRAARKHARKALWASPLSPESWKVMYCSLRGR